MLMTYSTIDLPRGETFLRVDRFVGHQWIEDRWKQSYANSRWKHRLTRGVLMRLIHQLFSSSSSSSHLSLHIACRIDRIIELKRQITGWDISLNKLVDYLTLESNAKTSTRGVKEENVFTLIKLPSSVERIDELELNLNFSRSEYKILLIFYSISIEENYWRTFSHRRETPENRSIINVILQIYRPSTTCVCVCLGVEDEN